MPRKKRVGGQFTYRCGQDVADQLVLAAHLLDTDVSSILTTLVLRGLPAVMEEASRAREAIEAASLIAPADYLLPNDPLLRRLIAAARGFQSENRNNELAEVVCKLYKPKYPTRDQLARAVITIVEMIDRIYAVEILRRGVPSAGLAPADDEPLAAYESQLRAKLAELLVAWERFLNPKMEDREGEES